MRKGGGGGEAGGLGGCHKGEGDGQGCGKKSVSLESGNVPSNTFYPYDPTVLHVTVNNIRAVPHTMYKKVNIPSRIDRQ